MAINFTKRKESSLLGHTVVLFEAEYAAGENPTNRFRIEASRYGIAFHGESPSISSTDELELFADYVSRAWIEHKKLVPKIEITKVVPQ